MFGRVHTVYTRMGHALEIGQVPGAPERRTSTVVVPVASMSRLVAEGVSAALSLGDEVIAVTICFDDPVDQAASENLHAEWDRWDPGVPLVTLHTSRRSLAEPLVDYLRELERTYSNDQLVVLIPEVQPARPWQRILHNQRGFVLEQAIQHSGLNVVICRLRYRLSAVAANQPSSGSGW